MNNKKELFVLEILLKKSMSMKKMISGSLKNVTQECVYKFYIFNIYVLTGFGSK